MAKVLVSEKYLHDIANAIRVKLGSQSTYTPAQMAAAIADITGSISGTITPSTDADKVLVSDSTLTAIANAIRAKLDVATTYTPAQMAEAILSIQAAGPTIASWASGTDEEIAAMIDAAHAGTIDLRQDGGWAVGDVRTITVGAFTNANGDSYSAKSCDIVITSFDEYMSCGNVMQFDFYDGVSLEGMNTSRTAAGGYNSCAVKNTTIPAVLNVLPDWMKSRLIEFNVTTTAGQSTDIVTVEHNKLALRSIKEFCNSGPNTGSQISYYATAANRVKRWNNNASYAWTRDAYDSSNYNLKNYFYQIDSSGNSGKEYADNHRAIAPFGCL